MSTSETPTDPETTVHAETSTASQAPPDFPDHGYWPGEDVDITLAERDGIVSRMTFTARIGEYAENVVIDGDETADDDQRARRIPIDDLLDGLVAFDEGTYSLCSAPGP